MGDQSTGAFAGELRVRCDDPAAARRLAAALVADDDAWVTTTSSDKEMVVSFRADSFKGLRRAMDDYCAALYVAEAALGLGPNPERT